MRTAFFVAGFLTLAAPVSATESVVVVWVHAGTLIDGLSASPRKDQAILIRGDRIVAVGPAASLPAPAGATVVDLSTRTVLPGLVDCHVHLADRSDRYADLYTFTDTPFDAAFAAV